MIQTARRDPVDPLLDRVNFVLNQVANLHFGDYCPRESWRPNVNIYRMERSVEVCMDLAGVDKETIDVHVERGRLTIKGLRKPPEPSNISGRQVQVVSMEIDHGQFCREIPLPEAIELHRVTSQYRDGLLWISLPLRVDG